ncbi:hypothetical protein HMPREF1208_00285 [Staphylococcus sp. HGB0015]|uniref:hypothetical protein n=1 Tax=Staphylococcus schleiferi TaxID=1295 RepID=UPI00034E1351|nr:MULTISPECIES: hypothetical protein [Staphylococcus]EPD53550.1 hypothetical protein HMPREF1208_00285 [Staphylococcus sp. HGB0015]UXR54556.1 hypothetical protein MUA46_09890 [Staphylococcus schleiferi]UXR56863.1 hypothetical protein MUA40_09630 [Staphylococcus schleiferi]UXR59147.1 hypothetical protein MUA91_09630 [Staphylococcus schleiferi]UXR61462.1 hypothetical protein MUA72_09860 [Staphylococcus schleiferi]
MMQCSLVHYLLSLDERLKETYETGHRLLSALKADDIQQLQFILQDSKTKDISQGLKCVIQKAFVSECKKHIKQEITLFNALSSRQPTLT